MRRSRPASVAACCTAVALALLSPGARAGRDHDSAKADWLSTAQRRAAAEEYRVSWQGQTGLADVEPSWQAPNREQGFRTYFTESGIRLVPRTEDERSWIWGLELTGYGRASRLWPVSRSAPQPVANRIDYSRGVVEEWYVNEPRGLEQGFTLWAPPQDAGPAGALPAAPGAPPTAGLPTEAAFLELELTGSLQPSISRDGQAIEFRTAAGVNVVRYAALLVTDATGRELASWMELVSASGSHRVRLLFDDGGAIYPLTVDPLATSPSWTADGDQGGVRFGQSVASAGDVNSDGYDDLIVGAPGYDNGEVDEGRAYLYLGSPDGLDTEPSWTAESNQDGARFGHSVAGAGDVNGDGFADVIVGAHLHDGGQADEGRAYIFYGSDSGLSEVEDWSVDGGQADAQLGRAVGSAGDVDNDGFADVVVGAPLHDVTGDEESFPDAGRVLVYHGSDAGPSEDADWTAEGDQAYAHFGHAVGSAGDVDSDGYDDLAVGAPLYDGVGTDEGRAYVYYGSVSGLAETAGWTDMSGQAFAYFGHSLGRAGDVDGDGCDDLIVGAYRYGNGEAGEGRAYVYHGSPGGLEASPTWTAESNQTWAYFGVAVGTAGDVDGDGYAEVIVGAHGYNGTRTDAGRVFIYQGTGDGLTTYSVRFADGTQSYSMFGESVGTAGDVNGDGFADVVVGAPAYFGEGDESGRAVVYHGADPVNDNEICAVLGDAPEIEIEEDVFVTVDIDEDIFAFNGTETEQVTVTLAATSGGGRANLYLMDDMGSTVELFEVDRTDLPNQITVTLPASGEYLITVSEQPDLVILPGLPFLGDYCLALHSDAGAAGSLQPTYTVESDDEADAEPASAEDGTERVVSPARQPRLGVKRRPLPR